MTPLEKLREEIYAEKTRYRLHLAKLPVIEKLKMLEEMRDFTNLLEKHRIENKEKMKINWANK